MRILHYYHRAQGDYRISRRDCKAEHIGFSCLAQFSSSSSHSPLKIILKQLFTSGSLNIAKIKLNKWFS